MTNINTNNAVISKAGGCGIGTRRDHTALLSFANTGTPAQVLNSHPAIGENVLACVFMYKLYANGIQRQHKARSG
jgi:hypothetical protein